MASASNRARMLLLRSREIDSALQRFSSDRILDADLDQRVVAVDRDPRDGLSAVGAHHQGAQLDGHDPSNLRLLDIEAGSDSESNRRMAFGGGRKPRTQRHAGND